MPILSWLTRETDLQTSIEVPYRLLEPVAELSAGEPSENMLIQGDNLEALKALMPFYAGKVKCIYIDPPYNTQSAQFQHYDDNLEHSQWLAMMFPRLELLRDFLTEDGFFCCQIDDSEAPYLKVILDEIFGRNNFITTFYVQVRYGNKTLAEDNDYQKVIEQCFIYAKNKTKSRPNKVTEEYKVDKFEWVIETDNPFETLELAGKKVEVFKPKSYRITKVPSSIDGLKETWATGSLINQKGSSGEFLDKNLAPRKEIDGLECLYKVYGIGEDGLGYRYFTGPKKSTATKGKFYSGVPLQRRAELNRGEATKTQPIPNFYDMAGNFGNCRAEGGVDFRSGKKPEAYIQKLLFHFSKPGDLILDSFLGSGSTVAVAHKMGRKYIGIEMGEHCVSLCVPRLKKVVEGEQTGISEIENWTGGGGFRFYRLGEPVFDEIGKINPAIRFAHLGSHIWFCETHTALEKPATSPLLGVFNGVAYYLLYNGILGDKRPDSGNVLTNPVFRLLPPFDGPKVIYGESSRLGAEKLKALNITFKQTPYDIKAR